MKRKVIVRWGCMRRWMHLNCTFFCSIILHIHKWIYSLFPSFFRSLCAFTLFCLATPHSTWSVLHLVRCRSFFFFEQIFMSNKISTSHFIGGEKISKRGRHFRERDKLNFVTQYRDECEGRWIDKVRETASPTLWSHRSYTKKKKNRKS